MRTGAAVVDRAEQIKWADVLDDLCFYGNVGEMIWEARECRHPDAQWLVALFPPETNLEKGRMAEVLAEHPDDPRALFLQ
jgi:hypothetical protein